MEILEKTATKLTLRYRPLDLWFVAAVTGVVIPVFLFLAIFFSLTSWVIYLWWYPLLLIFFVVAGALLLIYFGQVVTCEFDKNLGRFILKERNLLKNKKIERSLKEIIDVEISSRAGAPSSSYQIVLVLKSGYALPLQLDNSPNWQNKQKAVDVIREFLGLSPKPFLPRSD